MGVNKRTYENELIRLMELYEKDVLRLCCTLLKDFSMAEDATQETFLKVYKSLKSFRGECSEKTWIIKIAIHTCKDIQRSAWFRHVDHRITVESLPEPIIPSTQENTDLLKAIYTLSMKERQIVMLYYYEGMTLEEVSQIMRVSSAALSKRLKRIRIRLQQHMKGNNDDE